MIRVYWCSAIAALLLLAASVPAQSTGAQVVAGSAQIQQNGGNLNVTTASGRTIINWSSFGVPAGTTTHFQQPGQTAATLNRVTGGSLSAIYGTLSSNGRLYLINPNGVVIGPSGLVRTAGFVASTLDVSDASFLSGGTLNFAGTSGASVVNLGSISAMGGDVYLIARHVENHGTIEASGQVGLAAGTDVLLYEDGEDRLFVRPVGDYVGATGVLNTGAIQAASAELKASGNLYALAINQQGIIRATGGTTQGGRVMLRADGGDVTVSGSISAQRVGTDGQTQGGTIQVLGRRVALTDGSVLDVSGQTGGGQVNVGGSLQGRGPLPNAEYVFVSSLARIYADSTERGDAGTAVVWSDLGTAYFGEISAQALGASGDGGFVEVSGRDYLGFYGGATTLSAHGEAGTLLLDPTTIYIRTNTATPNTPFTFDGGSLTWTYQDLANAVSEVRVNVLEDRLQNSGNVVIRTASAAAGDGDIFVDGAIVWDSDFSLSLEATRDIVVNRRISNGGDGGLSLDAGRDIVVWNRIEKTLAGSLSEIVLSAGGSINVHDTIRHDGDGAIQLLSANQINIFDGGRIVSDGNASIRLQTALDDIRVNGRIRVHGIGIVELFSGRDVYIGDGTQEQWVRVGSRNGATHITGRDLYVLGSNGSDGAGAIVGMRRGNATGDILVEMLGNVVVQGGEASMAYAKIGHGAIGLDDGEGEGIGPIPSVNGVLGIGYQGSLSGSITVLAGGSVSVTGGTYGGEGEFIPGLSFAQIGHGAFDFGNEENTLQGPIVVQAGGPVTVQGGDGGILNYATIGHGGPGGSGNISGNVTVTSASDVSVLGGTGTVDLEIGPFGTLPSILNYASIGHTGFGYSGDRSGNVAVTSTGGSIHVQGGDAILAAARIGNGGFGLGYGLEGIGPIAPSVAVEGALPGIDGFMNAYGNVDGNIMVNAFDTVAVTGGVGLLSFAQIGHFGAAGSAVTGNIGVTAQTGDVLLTGRGLFGSAQVGHVATDLSLAIDLLIDGLELPLPYLEPSFGSLTGNISVSAGRDVILTNLPDIAFGGLIGGAADEEPALAFTAIGHGDQFGLMVSQALGVFELPFFFGSIQGDIGVTAGHNVELLGAPTPGDYGAAFAMIGHMAFLDFYGLPVDASTMAEPFSTIQGTTTIGVSLADARADGVGRFIMNYYSAVTSGFGPGDQVRVYMPNPGSYSIEDGAIFTNQLDFVDFLNGTDPGSEREYFGYLYSPAHTISPYTPIYSFYYYPRPDQPDRTLILPPFPISYDDFDRYLGYGWDGQTKPPGVRNLLLYMSKFIQMYRGNGVMTGGQTVGMGTEEEQK